MRHFTNLAALTLVCWLVTFGGCSKKPVDPPCVGQYTVTDQAVMFLQNAPYDHLQEDLKITRYLETIRPQLKKLITETPGQEFKNPVLPVFTRNWPTELTLFAKNGNLYHIYNLTGAPVDWCIENRSLEFTPDGQINVVDTGAAEPRN